MVNILHIIAPITMGGAENVLLSIERLIDRSSFQLFFCLFLNPKRKQNAFTQRLTQLNRNVSFIYLDRPWFDFVYFFRLMKIIRDKRIDVIHSHGYMPDFFGLVAAKLAKRPIVSTVHGWTSSTRSVMAYEYIQKKILRYFDIVIPVSQQINDDLLQSKISPSRLRKLNNIVAFDDFSDENTVTDLKERYKIGPRTQTLGVIGRLSKEKGHIFLLQALAMIRKDFPDIRLFIIGDGDQEAKLRQFVKAEKLDHQVHFCGFQNDVFQFYRLIDIFVLPSLTEGIPLVLLEAMYFNKPIVATDVGGVPELIKNGYNGALVRPRDSSALSEAILKLLQNRHYAKKLAENAHESFLRTNNPNKWIKIIQEIYQSLYSKTN